MAGMDFYNEKSNLEQLKVDDDIVIYDILPQKNSTKNLYYISRCDFQDIDKKLWNLINDPVIKDDYARDVFVNKYFSTCVFELRKNETKTISANQSVNTSVTIAHKSVYRKTKETVNSIETTLGITRTATVAGPSQGDSVSTALSAQLKHTYSIKNFTEYIEESSQSTTVTVNFDKYSKDRTIVWWELVKVLAIYRENKNDSKTYLIGLSDYYVEDEAATYVKGQLLDNLGNSNISNT